MTLPSAPVQEVRVVNTASSKSRVPWAVYWMIGFGVAMNLPAETPLLRTFFRVCLWPVQLGHWLAQQGVL